MSDETWRGLEESDWMLPVRAYVDGLLLMIGPAGVAELHRLIDLVFARAVADAEASAQSIARMRELFDVDAQSAANPLAGTTTPDGPENASGGLPGSGNGHHGGGA